jgi:hypothetical protein
MIFRVFLWFPSILQNCPSFVVFIGKNIARFPNLVPQLLSFFCKFVFSYLFGFLLSTSTRMRKISDFKI